MSTLTGLLFTPTPDPEDDVKARSGLFIQLVNQDTSETVTSTTASVDGTFSVTRPAPGTYNVFTSPDGTTWTSIGTQEVAPANADILHTVGDETATGVKTLDAAIIKTGLPHYDPRADGAVGDGVHDDTADLMTTIAKGMANGGEINLGRGTFLVSASGIAALTVTGSSVTINGAGVGRTIIRVSGSSHPSKVLDIFANRVFVNNLTIDGGGVADYGLYLDDDGTTNGGSYQCRLTNVEVYGCLGTPGIGFSNKDRAYSVKLDKCIGLGNNLGGYFNNRCQLLDIDGCHFYNNLGVTINGIVVTQFAVGDGVSRLVNCVNFQATDFEGTSIGLDNSYLVGVSGVQELSFSSGCYFNSAAAHSLGELAVNGSGAQARSYLALRDIYIDSGSHAPVLMAVLAGAVPVYASLENVYSWSPNTLHSVSDATNAAFLQLRNVNGASMLSSDTLGSSSPDLYGSAAAKFSNAFPRYLRRSGSQEAFGAAIVGDSVDRIQFTAGGSISGGTGAALDWTIQRQGSQKVGPNTTTDWQCGRGLMPSNFGAFQNGNIYASPLGSTLPTSGQGANGDNVINTTNPGGYAIAYKAGGAWFWANGTVYTPSLTGGSAPTAVAASTTAEQTFTVTGLVVGQVVVVNGPSPTAGTGVVAHRVSATNTLAITFLNATSASLTPAAGTYTVRAT